jgi:hypothetical protein
MVFPMKKCPCWCCILYKAITSNSMDDYNGTDNISKILIVDSGIICFIRNNYVNSVRFADYLKDTFTLECAQKMCIMAQRCQCCEEHRLEKDENCSNTNIKSANKL